VTAEKTWTPGSTREGRRVPGKRTGRRVGDDAPSERESRDGRDCPFT